MTNIKKYEGMTAQERTNILKDKLAVLMKDIIKSPERLKKFAQSWRTGFHTYSFRNNLLILIQNPDASLCAGRGAWYKKFKRLIKKEETYNASWILAPQIAKVEKSVFITDKNGQCIIDEKTGKNLTKVVIQSYISAFFSVPTYDVAQTEGEDLDLGMNSSKFEGKEFSIDSMIKCFPEFEIKVVEMLQDGMAKRDSNKVLVAKRKNKSQEVAALYHEIAHHKLGHTDPKKRQKRFEGMTDKQVKQIIELEAQATSYLVSACVGIDELEGSANYIVSWNGNNEKLSQSAEKVMSVADSMVKQIAKTLKVKK